MQWADVLSLFRQLSGKISGIDEFVLGFKAIRAQNITVATPGVYLYKAERPIPRVREASEIIYVGRTERGYQRWNWNDAAIIKAENWQFYDYILKQYGPITIWWADSDVLNSAGLGGTTNEQERIVLCAYFRHFLDWPPKNRPQNTRCIDTMWQ